MKDYDKEIHLSKSLSGKYARTNRKYKIKILII